MNNDTDYDRLRSIKWGYARPNKKLDEDEWVDLSLSEPDFDRIIRVLKNSSKNSDNTLQKYDRYLIDLLVNVWAINGIPSFR